jgi:long-chain-fatty-acid--[acyl-carrier-protein] ligase
MCRFLRTLFWSLIALLARFRYRVRVVNAEKLRELRGPTLVMPNHPAYIDPLLVMGHIRLRGGLRPVVTSSMYRKPLLYPMMRLAGALEVPDLTEHSRDAREQTLQMIEAIVDGVHGGGSFLIYPSGHTQRTEREEIGATRAVSEILQRCPEANVVLVRTRGAWGSMFSRAQTGRMPDLGRCALRAAGWLIAGLLFFVPKREVTMTVEAIDRDDLPGLDRERLNPFLEAWYNAGGPEPPTFVPYHCFLGPREFQYPDLAAASRVDLDKIRPATIAAVNAFLEEHLGRSLSDEEKRADAPLDQFGVDSLERMEIALALEDRFGFRSDRVAETLGELWALADGRLTDGGAVAPIPETWKRPSGTGEPLEVLGETLAEAFVRRALRNADDVAAADPISGVLTYRRLLVGARLMARRFAKLPGDAVGVILPASVAADLVFFALHMAGKLPVMLNWTTGPANLAHAVEKLRIRRVVASRRLIDRLGIEVRGADYVFLEDLRSGIGKIEALRALAGTYLLAGRLLRSLPEADPDAPAVVLFTSGSESKPKAVPLTHRNLIANLRDSLVVLQATRGDAMLGFLPPFHSFGLLGNVIATLLSGLRVVHHPDPTDAVGLVRAVAGYGTTILVTTPTFLSYMANVAGPDDLHSLRIIVTGAEKCPAALFDRMHEAAPNATILEGYGITECSPVVSGNRPGAVRLGTVGPPLDHVELCVVDPETYEPLPPGATGMLLVRGPSVFGGYLDYDGPDPFVEVDGRRWYVTGDLVQRDDDGYVHFRGRLKRFLKVGGEMVSLPALEEPFAAQYPPTDAGPRVGVEGVETPDGRWIVLFTTEDLTLAKANAVLAQAGLRGVMRIDEVVRLDAIPVLGTGKTDYKVLRRHVVERVQGAAK